MELSKFTNGDKKAIIQRADFTYTIEYFLKGRVIKKEIVSDFSKAESLAEEYILEDNPGPRLLNEDA